jgi:hypothetical protein
MIREDGGRTARVGFQLPMGSVRVLVFASVKNATTHDTIGSLRSLLILQY